jgi:hypothetical protein
MVRIECDENWATLKRVIGSLAKGDIQKEAELWSYAACQAYKNGHGVPLLLVDKVSGQLLSPKGPQLWQYLRPLADRLFLHEEDMPKFARCCKEPPPPSDAAKGASQPSGPPGELRPASEDMIKDEIRSAYDRAEAAREKPPNVKEVSRVVQLSLKQKDRRASRRQIEKLAEAEEFKRRRRPPGRTVASERRKKTNLAPDSELPQA